MVLWFNFQGKGGYMKRIISFVSFFAVASCASVPIQIPKTGAPEPRAVLSWDQTCPTYLVADTRQPLTFSGLGDGSQTGLASIAATALITAGVDYVGAQLKASAEDETRTASALINVTSDRPFACLKFSRGDDFSFLIEFRPTLAADGTPTGDLAVLEPVLRSFSYNQTIDEKTRGVRGLTLALDVSRPGSKTSASQTISLGNVEVGASVSDLDLEAALIANPFRTIKPASKDSPARVVAGTPFTFRVTLTEVRNANALRQFGSDVFAAANDDLTANLVGRLGLEDDQGATEEGDPELGANNVDGS